jgi:hypothetical protein
MDGRQGPFSVQPMKNVLGVMVSDPILPVLAEGFRDAVSFYQTSWSPAEHGPEVSIEGRPYTLPAVCAWVSKFDDRLPQDILYWFLRHMDARYTDLKDYLVSNPTYNTAALCLAKLIRDRTTEYERMEALRRGNS